MNPGMNPCRSGQAAAFERSIPSRLGAVDALCREVRAFCRAGGLGSLAFPLELALRECLNNAVLHGNRSDPAKRVSLVLSVSRAASGCSPNGRLIRVQVTDQGAGYDWKCARRAPLPAATAIHGRGLAIVAAYAQRIRFNHAGNQITLWFREASQQKGHKA